MTDVSSIAYLRGSPPAGAGTAAKAALTIDEWVGFSNTSRSTTYVEIRAGRLRAKKVGRRTLILVEDGLNWLRSRPEIEPDGAV